MILAYHRVTQTPTDPQLLCVSPRHFAEQLDVLKRHYRPMSLAGLAVCIQEQSVPDDAVVVTFDDGYADSLRFATPLLNVRDVPATVFVVHGSEKFEGEFWWDELDRLLLQPGELPDRLRLEIDEKLYDWNLGAARIYSPAAFEQCRGWNVLHHDAPGVRQTLYQALHQALRTQSIGQRQRVLNALRGWAGAEIAIRSSHARLSPDEVVLLTRAGIEVGAHTISHPVLASQSGADQRGEIEGSKRALEAVIGCPVRSFAYPYGTRRDYTAETVRIVEQAGFTCACANFPGLASADVDVYQLPRVLVRDWDGDRFARCLEETREKYR